MVDTHRCQPRRKVKAANVDYAYLHTGLQIPESSSSSDSDSGAFSSDEDVAFGSRRSSKRSRQSQRRRRNPSKDSGLSGKLECCVCLKQVNKRTSTSGQCINCARWYHSRCLAQRLDKTKTFGGKALCDDCVGAQREHQEHQPFSGFPSIKDFVAYLEKAKNVIVLAGAGISVSCGIPDFRSENGIYSLVSRMGLELPTPESLFHIDFFRENPAPFYQIVNAFFSDSCCPSITHFFLKFLQDQHKLLRVYSQNIDGLEEIAGVEREKYIPCHGSFATSQCLRCKRVVPTSSLRQEMGLGCIPHCRDSNCGGVLKPQVTLFGEKLSDRVQKQITIDRNKVDLLLVIGTSLQVSPIAELPGFLPAHVPQVIINRTVVKPKVANPKPFDLVLLGECDQVIRYLCHECGWSLDKTHKQTKDASQQSLPQLIAHKSSDKTKTFCFGKCCCDESGTKKTEKRAKVIEIINYVCDGCNEEINRGHDDGYYFSCSSCFDYDLCLKCYETKRKEHMNGQHRFKKKRTES